MKTSDEASVTSHTSVTHEDEEEDREQRVQEHHEKLVAKEHDRAANFSDTLEYYETTINALKRSLSSAITETTQVYNYIKQLAVAHDTLNSNLKLHNSSYEEIDDDELLDQGTEVSSVAQTSISGKEDDSLSYNSHCQAPVQFISFPNPQGSNPALYELNKLHDVFQFNTIDVSKLYGFVETLNFHRDELVEQQIESSLVELKESESATQSAWESYVGAQEKSSNKKPSTVWLAELQYHHAVQYQTRLMHTQERVLVNLISKIQDYEVERNSALPRLLSDYMTATQAVCKELAEAHAHTAQGLLDRAQKTRHSVSSRLKHVADFTGATAVLDAKSSTTVPDHAKEYGQPPLEEALPVDCGDDDDDEVPPQRNTTEPHDDDDEPEQRATGAVDMDEIVDCSTDEDLPLLADAQKKQPVQKSRHSSRKKKKGKKLVPKVKTIVVLDPSSSKHAFFIDRLLYTGSLLESHFCHWATVAQVGEEEEPNTTKTALVVLTVDRVLHIFDLAGSGFVVGSSAEAALQYVVQQFEAAEEEQARRQKSESTSASSSKQQSTKEPKATSTNPFEKEEEESKTENISFLLPEWKPTLSMDMKKECTVRITRRWGEHAVKITPQNKQQRHVYAAYRKLSFASDHDQQALIEAIHGSDSMLEV